MSGAIRSLSNAALILSLGGWARLSGAPVVTVEGGGDVAAAVNTAIARVSAAGGGTVMIAAGTYDLTAPIELQPGVRLIGDGGLLTDSVRADAYPTTLRAGRAGLPALIEGRNASGARVEHLGLDADGKADQAVITASYAFRMRDCAVRGGRRREVWVTDGKAAGHDVYVQPTFIDCTFDQEGRGIGIEASRDNARDPHRGAFTDGVICGCSFRRVGQYAATLCGGWQFFQNDSDGTVGVFGGATTLTDNRITVKSRPAIAVEASNVAITGNRLEGPTGLITVAPGINAVTVSDNRWVVTGGAADSQIEFLGATIPRFSAVFENHELAGEWKRPRLPARPRARPIVAVVSPETAGDHAAAAINAAIRRAAVAQGSVLVLRGTYALAEPIRLLPGVCLVGEGGMSRVPVGYEAMGTVLKAARAMPVLVDLTDAPGAGVDELAIDGALLADTDVRLAARAAWLDDSFALRARKIAVEVTNGDSTAAGAYDGVSVAHTLVHAGGDSTGLVVHRNPSAKGAPPANGTAFDMRLRLGFTQGDFEGGPGWDIVGCHGTSNGHSGTGFILASDHLYVSGNYFDTSHGPRVEFRGGDILFLGNHFQSTPSLQASTLIVAGGARGVSILSSTWHPAPGKRSRESAFAEVAPGAAANLRLVGNVGEGICRIEQGASGGADARDNFVAPPVGRWAADTAK